MMSSLRFREYVEAANLARQRAQSEPNPHAKQYCRKSNGPTIVWLKSKSGRWTSNNITVHLLISGRWQTTPEALNNSLLANYRLMPAATQSRMAEKTIALRANSKIVPISVQKKPRRSEA
jgi:hypothetical protein